MVERTVQMSDWEVPVQDYLDDHTKISTGIGLLILAAIGYGAYRGSRGIYLGGKRAVNGIRNSEKVQLAVMQAKSWVGLS